jgi:hypothetical protein
MVPVPDILDPTRKIRTLFQLFRRGSRPQSDFDDVLSHPPPSPSSPQTFYASSQAGLDKTSSIHTVTDMLSAHPHAHLHAIHCMPSSSGFSVTDEFKSSPSPIAIITSLSYHSESSTPVSDRSSPLAEISSERTVKRTVTATSIGGTGSIRSSPTSPRGDHAYGHVSVDSLSAKLIRDSEYYCDPTVPNDENCCVLRVEDTLFKVTIMNDYVK